MQYVTTEGTQGICPTGWHLPSDTEWKTMEMYLGMSQAQANAYNWRGTNEGSKMAGNEPLWTNGNLDSNPDFGTSGFASLPAGNYYTGGGFINLNYTANFWTSTGSSASAYMRYLHNIYTQVNRKMDFELALSVRCLKD